jgi:hypothetical protein
LSVSEIPRLSKDPAPDNRDFTSKFKNIKVFNGRTIDLKGLQFSVYKLFFGLVLVSKPPEWDGK